jgi:hypothetical protein
MAIWQEKLAGFKKRNEPSKATLAIRLKAAAYRFLLERRINLNPGQRLLEILNIERGISRRGSEGSTPKNVSRENDRPNLSHCNTLI